MLSKELENTLNETFRTARARRHEFITVEHLLLALLDDSAAVAVLDACQVDLDDLRGELTEFIDSTTPLLSDSRMAETRSQRWDSSACFSVLCFMFRVRGSRKSRAPTCWLLFFPNRNLRLFTS